MKKIIFIILTSLCIANTNAQTKDYQKQIEDARKRMEKMKSDPAIRKKMEEAQKQLGQIKADPGIQKEMAQAAFSLDSMKKLHPELTNVKMPDLGSAAIPNMDSLAKNVDASLSKMSQLSKDYLDALDKTMPTQNRLHHAEELPLLTKATLIAITKEVLKNVKPNLDIIEVNTLDKIVADTNTNAAGTGAFYLATGASKNVAAYLICNGILKDPTDAWAVNALGVYFRDKMLYEKSLQCYFYANALDAEKSTEINANIGWASAYYGDFTTAKKYFDNALSFDKNFTTALEGEALLAYQMGDVKALFECLIKELKSFGGNGGASSKGPSGAFANLTTGISGKENNINLDKQSDPTTNHTFDNNDAENEAVQDPPPGADVEPIKYPFYRSIFVGDAKELYKAAGSAPRIMMQSFEKKKKYVHALSEKLKTLKPIGQAPYIDDEGFFVFQKSFKKYVDLFDEVQVQFERRIVWYKQKYEKEIGPLLKEIGLSDVHLASRYYQALGACNNNKYNDDECINRVNCQWLPQLHGSKNSGLEAITRVWNKYSENIRGVINWYADATSPFISRVHDAGWNDYLNMKKEFSVRRATLDSYDEWATAVMMINTDVSVIIQKPMPVCKTELRMMEGGPDPFSKKMKKLKTFAGPCYTEPTSHDFLGFAKYEDDCTHTLLALGSPALKAFREHIYDRKFKEDDKTRSGFIVGVSKSISFDKKIGNDQLGASGKAGVELNAEATISKTFNSAGVLESQNVDFKASATASLEGEAHAGPASAKAGKSLGIEAGVGVKLVGGQAEISNVSGQITH